MSQASIWEFGGFIDADQATTSTVGSGYLGGGFATGLLDTDTKMFEWAVIFGGLTSPAFLAHIHEAPPGLTGDVVFGLGTPIGTGIAGLYMGSILLSDALIDEVTGVGAFPAGVVADWYVNIHTVDFPGGEIRGQLIVTSSPVPLPAAAWLMIPALGMLIGIRRTT